MTISTTNSPESRESRGQGHDLRPTRIHHGVSWVMAVIALFGTLKLDLLPALLAGLLMFELTQLIARHLRVAKTRVQTRLFAVGLLVLAIVALIVLAVGGGVSAVHIIKRSVPELLLRLADIIDSLRLSLPDSALQTLPEGSNELRAIFTQWLRSHASDLGHVGLKAARYLAEIVVGVAVGAMVALYDAQGTTNLGPLGRAMEERAYRLGRAFRGVVFGQVWIAAINSFFTALYLIVALPLCGVHLPLASALIGVTFGAGLLPVIGNLISNTLILIVSFSLSSSVALASLTFLVVIHKLEYFLNARIIGSQVQARSWELLIAMLVMESAFGVPGLIAAPVYYAYLKRELTSEKLI